jgi:hypothetical protein
MWISAHTTVPPGASERSAAGTSSPAGCAERLGGGLSRVARPRASELERHALCLDVAGASEREHRATFVSRDLRNEARRVAEPVQTDRARIARHPVPAVADRSRAQQRSRVDVVIRLGELQAESPVGHRKLGVSAVPLISGEHGANAQVLAPRSAVVAFAARPTEPRHADAVADGQVGDRVADGLHHPDDLMSQHERELRLGQIAVQHVQIRPADRAGGYADPHLARPRPRVVHVAHLQGTNRGVHDRGAHGRTLRRQ